MIRVLVAVLVLCTGGIVSAEEVTRTLSLDGATPSPATIADLSFIEGAWAGEALGGYCEEVWSAPAGGAMLGMFRLVVDDTPKFYELLTIREEGPSLVLQLKHFDPQLIGWEEKDDTVSFPLVKVDGERAYFDGLTFERDGDALHIYVRQRGKDGSLSELSFPLRRIPQ